MYNLSINTFEKSFNQTIMMAKNQPIEINTDDGTVLILQLKTKPTNSENCDSIKSPFDIEGIDVPNLTSEVILNAIRESRERPTSFDL